MMHASTDDNGMQPGSRVFVAGHRGLVGSAICRHLTAAGYERLLLRASTELAGTARLIAVIGGVLYGISTDRPLRAFLESDPETALRLLTGTRSAVHAGTVGALENLIDLERQRGSFDASIDTPALAYAIVRLSEGFLYADVIAARAPGIDRGPDIDRAITLIEALLLGLDLSSSPAPGPAFRCSPR